MSGKECYDVRGIHVAPGHNYVPGPDYCSVCKCEDGNPHFCRAVLCQPRQDCMSFRVGSTCCDFICLDDFLPNLPDEAEGESLGENSLGVRLAAAILTALMAFVLLLFLVHRLRQRRMAAQQYANAQDAACCHSAAYWHSNDQAQLFLRGPPCPPWKPPSCSIDAPPPYSEADAQRAQLVASSTAPPSYAIQGSRTSDEGYAYHLRNGREGSLHFTSDEDNNTNDSQRIISDVARQCSTVPPISLGPLAVQLLPTAPGITNTNDLREQIQRQRQNLTDHTIRTLPRQGIIRASHRKPATMTVEGNTLTRVTSPTVCNITVNALQSTADNRVQTDPQLHLITRVTMQNEARQEAYNDSDAETDEILSHWSTTGDEEATRQHNCTQFSPEPVPTGCLATAHLPHKSTVRQSVLRFEAVAALEVAGALSQRNYSPTAIPEQSSTVHGKQAPGATEQQQEKSGIHCSTSAHGKQAKAAAEQQQVKSGIHCSTSAHGKQAKAGTEQQQVKHANQIGISSHGSEDQTKSKIQVGDHQACSLDNK